MAKNSKKSSGRKKKEEKKLVEAQESPPVENPPKFVLREKVDIKDMTIEDFGKLISGPFPISTAVKSKA